MNHLRGGIRGFATNGALAGISLGCELGGMLLLAVSTAEKGFLAVDGNRLAGLGRLPTDGTFARTSGLFAELVGLGVLACTVVAAEADKL